MQIKLLAFAQARDLLGFQEREVEYQLGQTPRELLSAIAPQANLTSFRVAIDQEYSDWDVPLVNARELALIPPVSGG